MSASTFFKFDWPGLIKHPNCTPDHRLVLCCLAAHADNNTHECGWGTPYIIKWTGLSRAVVNKILVDLAKMGAIRLGPYTATKRRVKILNLDFRGDCSSQSNQLPQPEQSIALPKDTQSPLSSALLSTEIQSATSVEDSLVASIPPTKDQEPGKIEETKTRSKTS